MKSSIGKGPSFLARNVLGNYLETVTERRFDLPFLSLLWAMGYSDIHLTHGQTEFGKDFIAKGLIDGKTIQYSFQLKQGNINQARLRNEVLGQLFELSEVSLSHPQFDTNLDHQPVLVLTGRLTSNAALVLQDMNRNMTDRGSLPVEVWDYDTLLSFLVEYGIEQVHAMTASSLGSYGNFYVLYGKALQDQLEARDLELHFRSWLNPDLLPPDRILGAVTEAELLSQLLEDRGFLYEQIQCYQNAYRILIFSLDRLPPEVPQDELLSIINAAISSLSQALLIFAHKLEEEWNNHERDLVQMTRGPSMIMGYLVNCARTIETLGLAYFYNRDDEFCTNITRLLKDFFAEEIGASHTPSDNYTVSLFIAILALHAAKETDSAKDTIRKSIVWLCDRYENGFGLAPFGSDPRREIEVLFGYPFDFIDVKETRNSFLASALTDLSAYIAPTDLYPDVVNDLKAVSIYPQYWQLLEESALYEIGHRSIVTYPNITFSEESPNFSEFNYAEHIGHELGDYQILHRISPISLLSLSAILRDRYFPWQWPVMCL